MPAKKKTAKIGRPTAYKPQMCQTVVDCGKQGKGPAEMASEIGVSRQTMWNWTKKHQDFFDALKRAYDEGLAWWERKGREGSMGQIQGFNSTAYIFQMKNRFRDEWRDKIDHGVEFSGDINITLGGNVDD